MSSGAGRRRAGRQAGSKHVASKLHVQKWRLPVQALLQVLSPHCCAVSVYATCPRLCALPVAACAARSAEAAMAALVAEEEEEQEKERKKQEKAAKKKVGGASLPLFCGAGCGWRWLRLRLGAGSWGWGGGFVCDCDCLCEPLNSHPLGAPVAVNPATALITLVAPFCHTGAVSEEGWSW